MKRLSITIFLIAILISCLASCAPNNSEVESQTYEYKVLSVSSYYKVTRTNTFGAILDQELRYTFTYMDDAGKIYQFEDFEHIPGTWELRLGTENKYIVKQSKTCTYRYLYLTEEMFNKLSS